MPKRIQRKRTKGWRMPEGAVYVGRPSKWGNPWTAGGDAQFVMRDTPKGVVKRMSFDRMTPATVVELYRFWITRTSWNESPHDPTRLDMSPLAGRDLVCWCPLDQPCHADVLLEIANGEVTP